MVVGWFKKEYVIGWALFFVIFMLALGVRVLGLSQPYHQDEYKWALAANPAYHMADTIPHPPLALFFYHHIGAFVGYEKLRVVPMFFSLVLLILLFLYLRSFFSTRAALIGSLLFAVTPYALLGSLQIDIDGVFLPLMALATFFGYFLWQRAQSVSENKSEKKWGLALLLGGLILGFGFKLSFILVPLAIVADLFFRSSKARAVMFKKEVLVGVGVGAVAVATLLALLWNHIGFLRYVDNFVALHGRDYFEILFLTVKGAIYFSPVLFFGMLLGVRYRKELSLWYFFLAVNILFYFVVFDFSHRTFDRYLLFLVLPACIVTAVWIDRVLHTVLGNQSTQERRSFFFTTALSTGVLGLCAWYLFSLTHRIIPLLPKTAFISAVVHGHWRFLLPMTGGSGPLGFYLPVDALAFLWVVSGIGACLVVVDISKGVASRYRWSKKLGVALFISAGFVYVLFVGSEYLFGTFYGNAGAVISSLMQEIDKTDSAKIKQQGSTLMSGGIITYNDVGAYELLSRGLYAGRFYPHDQFIEGNRQKFAAHPGLYLLVNMPELSQTSVYTRYFAQCHMLAGRKSGQIAGYLFDCSHADPGVIRLGTK